MMCYACMVIERGHHSAEQRRLHGSPIGADTHLWHISAHPPFPLRRASARFARRAIATHA